jgi:hypothetical protein
MPSQQVADDFQAFYAEQAPAVYQLAVRHGGGREVARDCVEAVFAELAGNWRRVSDPVRFSRRAAVLFVRGSTRRRGGRAIARRCRPQLV